MKADLFSSPSIDSLKRALSEASIRHTVIAHNLANAETEGYVPRRVVFREALADAMAGGQPRPYRLEAAPEQGLDQTLVDLVENAFTFSASARLLARKYDGLLASVRGRSA